MKLTVVGILFIIVGIFPIVAWGILEVPQAWTTSDTAISLMDVITRVCVGMSCAMTVFVGILAVWVELEDVPKGEVHDS